MFGLRVAIWLVAAMTFLSGLVVVFRMRETLLSKKESISPHDLKQKIINRESLFVFDVRSTEEFEAGHIQGAFHVPKELLLQKLSSLPNDATVVTNCGKGGGRSIEAMQILRANGLSKSFWLEGGYIGYKEMEDTK
jgi:rhodanese-related sulfurtransferase